MNINSLVRFKRNNKYGLKNKYTNFVLLQPKYHDIRRISNTDLYMRVRSNHKWGVIDCMGKLIVHPIYDEILSYWNFSFIAMKDKKKFFIPYSKDYYKYQKKNPDEDKKPIGRGGSGTTFIDDHWKREDGVGWDWSNY